MNLMNLPRLPITFACAITWTFVSFAIYPSRVSPQSSRAINNISSSVGLHLQQERQKSYDFSGVGRTGPRKGGGSRGGCPFANQNPSENQKPSLTALIPVTNWGRTVASRPTFWFYVPYSPQEAISGEFVLREEVAKNGNNSVFRDIYRIPFTLPKTPGLVSFSLPPTKPPLEIDKWYRWEFQINCVLSSSVSDLVMGWVQRIEMTPKLERELKAATIPEYDIYASNLIWYDALQSLIRLRLTQPANSTLSNEWTKLLGLKGIELEELGQKPLIGSVVVQE